MAEDPEFTYQKILALWASLREAFVSESPVEAVKWMEQAYQVNHGSSNLNLLLDSISWAAKPYKDLFSKALNAVLVQALIHDESMTDHYLETLWQYLQQESRERLDAFRNSLKRHTRSGQTLNTTSEKLEHIGLLYLVKRGIVSTTQRHLTDLIDHLLLLNDSPAVANIIAFFARVDPGAHATLSHSFTNELKHKKVKLNPENPARMNLFRLLYTCDYDMMECATTVLKFEIHQLMEYYACECSPFDPQKINDLGLLISSSLTDKTQSKLIDEMQEAFESICLTFWRHEQIEASMPMVVPALQAIIQQLNALGLDTQAIITHAFNTQGSSVNNANTDYLESAAEALMNCHGAPIKRWLATDAFKDLTTEQLLQHFKKRPELLAEVYKITNNSELIAHMNHQARHASISHDLGL